MSVISRSARGQDISVRELSVKLAHLHNQLHVRTWRRDLAAAWVVMVVLSLVSLPVFKTLEQWSIGDTSWFMYITITGVGLGDIIITTTPAVAYWFFFVFITIGTEYIFVCSIFVVFGDLHRRLMWWLAERWGISDGATIINRDENSDVTSSIYSVSYSVGPPEEYTYTISSLLQAMQTSDVADTSGSRVSMDPPVFQAAEPPEEGCVAPDREECDFAPCQPEPSPVA
jgi:hypothetical protein